MITIRRIVFIVLAAMALALVGCETPEQSSGYATAPPPPAPPGAAQPGAPTVPPGAVQPGAPPPGAPASINKAASCHAPEISQAQSLAFQAYTQKDYQTAITHLTHAINICPTHCSKYYYLLYSRALNYRAVGDMRSAMADMYAAAQANPRMAPTIHRHIRAWGGTVPASPGPAPPPAGSPPGPAPAPGTATTPPGTAPPPDSTPPGTAPPPSGQPSAPDTGSPPPGAVPPSR